MCRPVYGGSVKNKNDSKLVKIRKIFFTPIRNFREIWKIVSKVKKVCKKIEF